MNSQFTGCGLWSSENKCEVEFSEPPISIIETQIAIEVGGSIRN